MLFTAAALTPALAQDDDGAFRPAEPDFTLDGLPTSLRLPKFGSAFRVTHRFLRPLGQGDFGDLADDLFGLDNGAAIGLEYRFGIVPHGQIGIHRTSFDKTIEFFGEYGVVTQGTSPVDVTAWASVEGLDNFRESRSPALGAILSRRFGDIVAGYVEPIWVNNSNPLPKELNDDNDTFMVGVGARLHIRPTVYLVGEIVPRVSGYNPGTNHASFAIEKHVGGHVFQLNFSDSTATTMGQLARGGTNSDDWYLGFNISRKFF
jgi:hypothetical protein